MKLIPFLYLLIFVTSLWAGFDAGRLRKQGATTKDLGGSPLVVFFVCLIVWIIAFPYYLIHRERFIAAQKSSAARLSMQASSTSEGFCGSCGAALYPTNAFCTKCGTKASH
jgi:zona occludens toxin (predicted ATPase)